MIRGHIIALIVLLALVLLGSYLASISTWKEQKIPTPLGGDAALNPFYAAERLTNSLGAKSMSRRSLGDLPPADGVLVLTAWHWSISAPRRESIERWVEAGGRLVVDSSLFGFDELLTWAGLEYRYPDDSDDEEEDEENEAEPLPDCRDFESQVSGGIVGEARNWELCGMDPAGRFIADDRISWGLADESGLQVVRVPVGEGSVTVVDGTPFTWRELQRVDHARLLVRALALQRGDQVVFLSADREQSLLELIWQNGAAAVLLALLAIGIALWRSVVSFGPPLAAPPIARRSLVEQIRGTGRFLLRANGAGDLFGAVQEALERAAERRIRGWHKMSEAERLDQLSAVTGIERGRLATARDWPRQARKADLTTSIACLEATRRLLAAK